MDFAPARDVNNLARLSAALNEVIDAHGSAFITAVATLDDDVMEVHFPRCGQRPDEPADSDLALHLRGRDRTQPACHGSLRTVTPSCVKIGSKWSPRQTARTRPTVGG